MTLVHRARRLVPVALLAAAAAWAPARTASACGPMPEEAMRHAVDAHIAALSPAELEALLARLQREATLARARAEKRAQAAAAKRTRTASRQ